MKACVLAAVDENPRRMAALLADHPAVAQTFPVLGRPEVVLRLAVADLEELAEVLDWVSSVPHVVVSETLLEIPQVVRG